MRLIDSDVVTTDSVSFGRISDFENSSASRPRQGTCGLAEFTKQGVLLTRSTSLAERRSITVALQQ
jgi:hypothetical protein